MMPGKKPALVFAISAGGKKPAESEPEEGAEMDEGPSAEDAAKLSAAKDLMAAIKSGDAQAVSDALEAHRECCMGDEE